MTISRGAIPGLAVLLVVVPALVAWLALVGNPSVYLRYEMPPGQSIYIFSRFFGLLAFGLLWLQAMLAVAKALPTVAKALGATQKVHRTLGLITVGALVAHAALFIMATSLRAGHSTLHWLVPEFSGGFYVLQVSLGTIALWIFIVVALAGWLRRRFVSLKWLHLLWLPGFVLVYVHATSIGSETRLGFLEAVYLFYLISLALMVAYYFWWKAKLR
ncbi:hypothetical protein CAI21_07820 [Alkalilimnicola ehrlichii]|uniref:Ferric oxidoreductase domain-containing protein n=1 Tax=Alkalilimnicola ehrlichii TaxID=351052 RepID=A0A3E0WWR6_9GAMM|nr:hypothetical protein [Alkalilimnicola ehrlichii]RFA30099.1 hypothetical protein CAI21_07820 [Alkalilimnicola ehrlichii]RFA37444.1 hypothetical protein CAL65_09160 [Alkalilimnicola ehrlichii]